MFIISCRFHSKIIAFVEWREEKLGVGSTELKEASAALYTLICELVKHNADHNGVKYILSNIFC